MKAKLYKFLFACSAIFLFAMLFVDLNAPIQLAGLKDTAIYQVFYLHLSCAINSYLMLLIAVIAGIVYLRRKSEEAASWHFAAIELSFLLISFVLLSGMLWAKASWGVFFNFEPRLVAAAVYWFLLLSLLLVKSAIEGSAKYKFSALFSLIILLNVPFIHFATSVFARKLHPAAGTLNIRGYEEVRLYVWLTVLAVCIFALSLLKLRAELAKLKIQLANKENKTNA